MHVMNLLTEHKISGLAGEDRVAELRDALVDTREILRTETYGGSAPIAPPQVAVAPPTPPAAIRPDVTTTVKPADATVAVNANDMETLRRCNALLRAHIHSSLEGEDLVALREGLADSLQILERRLNDGVGSRSNSNTVGDATLASSNSPRHSPPLSPAARRVEDEEDEPVPSYVGGIQSIGGVLSDMEVGKRPEKFEPENGTPPPGDAVGAAETREKKTGWVDGSLGKYERDVATKALGYLLKHRGGKGYGRGRVKGEEAENMICALAEMTEILHDEMVEV